MATTDTGMGAGTKIVLTLGTLVALAWIVPYLADLAAANPEKLRRAASATRRVRAKAIRKGAEGARRSAKYLREKLA